MSQRVSRRTLMALAGVSVVSAGTLQRAVAAQTASSHSFAGGSELSWVEPWVIYDTNTAAAVLPDSVSLFGAEGGEFLIGYYEAATSIDDSVASLFGLLGQDPSLAQNVAGGGGDLDNGDGTVSNVEYSVHTLTMEDEAWGFYFELVDGLRLIVFVAPVAVFATEMASAHGSIALNGTGVLEGVDGAAVQQELESAGNAGDTASPEVGEFTDVAGVLHVTWTNGWTVNGQNDTGIELTNPANSITLFIQTSPVNGKTWQGLAEEDMAFLHDDQGATATISGPEVTESGHSFASNGEYGLRLVQGFGTDNPDLYVLVFAANMAVSGADVLPLLQEAQAAVLINGTPPLVGLENFL